MSCPTIYELKPTVHLGWLALFHQLGEKGCTRASLEQKCAFHALLDIKYQQMNSCVLTPSWCKRLVSGHSSCEINCGVHYTDD
mmetsp:Transcript_143488/g.250465  ORF Transcript_143488/g.250465 Transcript_143488/m.250465 type:complete len:83 (+) Transcript_143488:196-444(+)